MKRMNHLTFVASLVAFHAALAAAWRYEQSVASDSPTSFAFFGRGVSSIVSFDNGTSMFASADRNGVTILTNGRGYHRWDQHRIALVDPLHNNETLAVRAVDLTETPALIVGVARRDGTNGAVFFVRLPHTEDAVKITPPSSVNDTHGFGNVVASSPDRIAISIPGDRSVAIYTVPETGAPVLEAVVRCPDREDIRNFGAAIDISSDVLVVGAPDTANPTGGNGFVLTYRRDAVSGTWSLSDSVLSGATYISTPFFGASVAVSDEGDVLAVGCPCKEGTPSVDCMRKVVVFEWAPEVPARWSLRDEIVDPRLDDDSDFGLSLVLDGGVLAIGAPRVSGSGSSGHVYVYKRSSLFAVVERPNCSARFGEVIAMSQDVLVVGSPEEMVDGVTFAGALFLFSVSELSALTLALVLAGVLLVVVFAVLSVLSCSKLHPSSVVALSHATSGII